MFSVQRIGKDGQGSDRGLTKVLSQHLPGETEAKHRNTARTTGIRARFEAGTTWLQVYGVTATLTCSETRRRYLHGQVTWSSVLTCLMTLWPWTPVDQNASFAGPCKRGNAPWSSKICGECLDQLSDYQFSGYDFPPNSWFTTLKCAMMRFCPKPRKHYSW